MERPVVLALIFLIGGILVGRYGDNLGIVIFSIFAVAVCAGLHLKYRAIYAYAFLAVYTLGIIVVNNSVSPRDARVDMIVGKGEPVIEGKVSDSTITSTNRMRIKLATERIFHNGMQYEVNMNVQVLLDEGVFVEMGQQVAILGELNHLDSKRNEGGFDEFIYLRSRKIEYKVFGTVIHKGEVIKTLNTMLNDFKNRLGGVYDLCLPEKEAGLMKSIMLGDKSGLDDYLSELYRVSGVYHILAISGAHIAILYMSINYILRRLVNIKLSSLIALVILILYCMLTGSEVATVRAVTMCAVMIIGEVIYRKHDAVTSVSVAAACLLLYEPLYLWDIGFQYSFSAVYAMVLTNTYFELLISMISDKTSKFGINFNNPFMKKYLPVALSAFLATLPISLFHFYYFMPYTLLSNLIIAPTTTLLTVVGFVVATVGIVNLDLAILLSATIYSILIFYENVFIVVRMLPMAEILIGNISLITVALFYVAFITFIFCLKYIKDSKLYHRWKNFLIVSSALLVVSFVLPKIAFNDPEIVMLDIGQGDSFVLSYAGKTVVIDGGGTMSGVGRNTGFRVLVPYLNYKGVDKVDMVFVTHTDADHIVGIIELLEWKKVGRIVMPKAPTNEGELYAQLEMASSQKGIEIEYLDKGDRVTVGKFEFDVIHPDPEYLYDNPNDNSLVLDTWINDFNILFTGDVDSSVLEKVSFENDLKTHIYKVAHHGSKNSASEIFLSEVSPDVAIVSAGRNNRFSHPNVETVEMFEQFEIPLYNTAKSGAVKIKLKKGRIEISTMVHS